MRTSAQIFHQPYSFNGADKLRNLGIRIIQIAEDTSLLMAGLHAIRHSLGIHLTALTAERALANEAMQARLDLGLVAHAVGAGVDAHLACHALGVVNPYGAVLVLLARASRASRHACRLLAMHAQSRQPVAMNIRPRSLNTIAHNRVVNDIHRELVPRTASNRAGMAADAATLVDNHNVTCHINQPPYTIS